MYYSPYYGTIYITYIIIHETNIKFCVFSELFCELSPSTSIIGALVAQTALNTVMDKPVNNYNVFFYDHIEHEGKYCLL